MHIMLVDFVIISSDPECETYAKELSIKINIVAKSVIVDTNYNSSMSSRISTYNQHEKTIIIVKKEYIERDKIICFSETKPKSKIIYIERD